MSNDAAVASSPDSESDEGPIPPPKEGKTEEIFEVEKILNHRLVDNVKLQLLVRWLGYSSDEDTWEPEVDLLETAGQAVNDYLGKLKVNDVTELTERIQRQMHKNKSKKRPREKSDKESDDSDTSFKSSAKRSVKKSRKSTKNNSKSSRKSPKVPTKAAVKSYEATPTAAPPAAANNAKIAALVVSRRRFFEESSDEEPDAPDVPLQESDIDKIANKVKVKSKAIKEAEAAENAVKTIQEEVKSPSPQPCCSSSFTSASTSKNQSKTREVPFAAEPTSSASSEPAPTAKETRWFVNGIVRHVDERNCRKKLVLMTNKETGVRKVLEANEAYELDGWALTKYLLDRNAQKMSDRHMSSIFPECDQLKQIYDKHQYAVNPCERLHDVYKRCVEERLATQRPFEIDLNEIRKEYLNTDDDKLKDRQNQQTSEFEHK
ncbi:unnamed protein product [Caenorhabditis sp. 36 PRJEB53466]|nr:unnamed protein product [Caenorhabditis sp. 36 PRJEB53466]